jgi:hypothetical protein
MCTVLCCTTTTITTGEQMLACEHVIGKCAESDTVVALFLQRRRASDYLAVSYSNRAALTADKMQRYQVRIELHRKTNIPQSNQTTWYTTDTE